MKITKILILLFVIVFIVVLITYRRVERLAGRFYSEDRVSSVSSSDFSREIEHPSFRGPRDFISRPDYENYGLKGGSIIKFLPSFKPIPRRPSNYMKLPQCSDPDSCQLDYNVYSRRINEIEQFAKNPIESKSNLIRMLNQSYKEITSYGVQMPGDPSPVYVQAVSKIFPSLKQVNTNYLQAIISGTQEELDVSYNDLQKEYSKYGLTPPLPYN